MNGAVDLPLNEGELSFIATGDSRVRRSLLSSGVRILSESVPGSRSATVGFWVAVGSRDETGEAETPGAGASFGSTHFLEHLLFKGTNQRTALDIAISFDSVGGEHNAVTAKEYTCYYAKVQDRDLAMAVEVIADMVTSSVLDPVEFENERGVILEELSMAEDDPTDRAHERLFESVFEGHPLGRPIGGSPATIRAASRDTVWQHYRANYRPQDLVITAAGSVDHDALVCGVERALEQAGWTPAQASAPVERRATTPVTLGAGPSVVCLRRPLEQASVAVGMPGLVATDERRATLSVLNSVLGGGMSSRLFQEIRERRGLAYSVYSFTPSYSDAGLFGLFAGCSPERAGEVARLMLAELHRLADFDVTADELARAVGQLSGGAALALEDSDTRMSRLGRAEITLGEFVDLDESLRRLERVTAADVHELAGELASGPVSIVAVGNVEDDAFAAVPV